MNQAGKYVMLTGGIVVSFFVQQPPRTSANSSAMHAQSSSSVSLSGSAGEQTVEIHNVVYEVTGDVVPGRPRGQRILLREKTSAKQVLGDMGQEATTTLEAWPLGVDVSQKPLYALQVSGTGGQTVDDALFIAERGLEDVQWWSVYRLGTGQHLFDTYVPLLSFSISKGVLEQRYVGMEVPPDNTPDARLKRLEVVAVLTYASADGVKREVLLTCDDPRQAEDMRSYEEATRALSIADARSAQTLNVGFRFEYPSAPPSIGLSIPIVGDDLDIAHARLAPHLQLSAFTR